MKLDAYKKLFVFILELAGEFFPRVLVLRKLKIFVLELFLTFTGIYILYLLCIKKSIKHFFRNTFTYILTQISTSYTFSFFYFDAKTRFVQKVFWFFNSLHIILVTKIRFYAYILPFFLLSLVFLFPFSFLFFFVSDSVPPCAPLEVKGVCPCAPRNLLSVDLL